MKSNTQEEMKIRSLKNYANESVIQRITLVINKIETFKEIRIKSYSQNWFDGEVLDKIILRDNLKASRLNIDKQLQKEAKINTKINIQKLIKDRKWNSIK